MKKYLILLLIALTACGGIRAQLGFDDTLLIPKVTPKNTAATLHKPFAPRPKATTVEVHRSSDAAQYDYEVGGIFYRRIGADEVEVTYHDTLTCTPMTRYQRTRYDNPYIADTYEWDWDYETYGAQSAGFYRGDITIPAQIQTPDGTFRVTRIGRYAFGNAQADITSLTLAEGIKVVDDGALFNTSLPRLILPAGIDTLAGIWAHAYEVQDIRDWLSISCLNGTTLNDAAIIVGGDTLRDLVVPEGIRNISAQAFFGYQHLRSVTLPEGLARIGRYAFAAYKDGESQLARISFPTTLREISDLAFSRTDGMKTLTLPEGLQRIGGYAFEGCMLNAIGLPSTLRTVGDHAFNVNRLETIHLPASLDSIGLNPFSHNEPLRSLTVAASNASFTAQEGRLYDRAFHRLIASISTGEDVTRYTMPTTLQRVDPFVFYDSHVGEYDISSAYRENYYVALYSQNVRREKFYIKDLNAFCRLRIVQPNNGVYYVPWGEVILCDAEGKPIEDLVIPEGIESLSDCAFVTCVGLRSVSFPTTLKRTGHYAFVGCSDLHRAVLNVGLKEVGVNTFNATPMPELELHVPFTQPWPFFVSADEKVWDRDQYHQNCFGADEEFYERVKLFVPEGAKETYLSTPGWELFTHVYEGTETPSTDPLGLTPSLTASEVVIRPVSGGIEISAEQGVPLVICTPDGRTLLRTLSTGNPHRISLPAKGIYVIKVGTIVKKLRL